MLRDVAKTVKWFVAKEKKLNDSSLSFSQKLWCWKNGFFSLHPKLYGLNESNKDQYLDNITYKKKHPINGIYSKLIDNKAFLHTIFPHTADIQVIFQAGKEISRKGLDFGPLFQSLQTWWNANPEEKLIIKPLQGSGGKGVFELLKHDWEKTLRDKISNKDSFLINEKLDQLDYSKQIFQGSVNTIRLVFFRDWETQYIHIAGCAHRFGTSFSVPVDNAGRNGMFTEIDHHTGVLGRSFIYLNKTYGGWHDSHPETKVQINGIQIPQWTEKIAMVTDELTRLTWLKYGGLDLVFTKTGFKVLEINSLPDLELVQMKTPLLSQKDFRNFFERL